MLAASLRHPHLVCQLTPTSTTYKIDNVLQRLIGEGPPGRVAVRRDATRCKTASPICGGDLHWRHDWTLSGYNTLNIGASYESMMRWLGRGNRVMAMAKVHVPYRRNANGALTSVSDSRPRRYPVRIGQWRSGAHADECHDRTIDVAIRSGCTALKAPST